MWLIIIILLIIIVVFIYSKDNYSKQEAIEQKKFDEKYGLNKKSNIETIFLKPQKLFAEEPTDREYIFKDEFHAYKNDVRYTVSTLTSKIKGLYYRHKEEIDRATHLLNGYPLYLEKEPNNEADRFAIKVKTWDGYCIGYIDSKINFNIWRLLDECFLVKCYVYQAGFGDIPYQWAVIYTVKDKLQDTKITISQKDVLRKTSIEPPKQDEVYLIDYKDKLKRLRENIKNSQKSADELLSKGKMKMYQNAIDRIKMYEDEISRLEILKENIDQNKII